MIIKPEKIRKYYRKCSNNFAADCKYDVGKIRMEPQRINLTSELPISLQAYRTFLKEKIEIKELIQILLKAD